MEIHLIQKHILKKLSQHKVVRYADLKPPHVEGNQFTYHLKTLATRGFLKKIADGYALTTKGLHYVTQVNFEFFFVRAQPKIVTLVVCRNEKDEYLLYTRNKEPFLGQVGFPYGKVHLGEAVRDAAERELEEKTGYRASLTHKGIAYLLVTDTEGEVITHMLCHIFFAQHPKGELKTPSPFGKTHWETEKTLFARNTMPGVFDTLRIATHKGKGLLFEELCFEVA